MINLSFEELLEINCFGENQKLKKANCRFLKKSFAIGSLFL